MNGFNQNGNNGFNQNGGFNNGGNNGFNQQGNQQQNGGFGNNFQQNGGNQFNGNQPMNQPGQFGGNGGGQFNGGGNMPEMNVDMNEQPSAGFGLLDRGRYLLEITAAEYVQNNNQNGYVLKIQSMVNGGDFNGRTYFDNFNLQHENQTTQQIAQRDYAALCLAIFGPGYRAKNPKELEGKKYLADIDVYTPKKKNQNPDMWNQDSEQQKPEPRNRVTAYMPFNGGQQQGQQPNNNPMSQPQNNGGNLQQQPQNNGNFQNNQNNQNMQMQNNNLQQQNGFQQNGNVQNQGGQFNGGFSQNNGGNNGGNFSNSGGDVSQQNVGNQNAGGNGTLQPDQQANQFAGNVDHQQSGGFNNGGNGGGFPNGGGSNFPQM